MPPTAAHPGPARFGPAPLSEFCPVHAKRQNDRLPPLVAFAVILALSALGWLAVIQGARLLRAALLV